MDAHTSSVENIIRTLWGECEQAMHVPQHWTVMYSWCFISEVSDHSKLSTHAWYVAIMRLINSTVHNSLEENVMVAEKSLSWSSITKWSHLSYTSSTLCSSDSCCCRSWAMSKHSLACIALLFLFIYLFFYDNKFDALAQVNTNSYIKLMSI